MKLTPKIFRSYVEKELPGITDKELFTSACLSQRLTQMATAITGRYHRPVQVILIWGHPELAFTNNSTITINTGHKYITSLTSRIDRFRLIVGLLAHEVGHILYTDFKNFNQYFAELKAGRWYPNRPAFRYKKYAQRLKKIQKVLNAKQIQAITHDLFNIFEDAVIEAKLVRDFPGSFREGIQVLNRRIFEQTPTTEEICASSESEAERKVGLIFRYIRCGDRDFKQAGPRRNRWLKVCEPYMRQAVTGDMAARLDAVNHILVLLWPYIDPETDVDMPPMPGPAAPKGSTTPVKSQYGENPENPDNEAKTTGGSSSLVKTAESIRDAVLKQLAEEKANQKIETELQDELNQQLQRMDLGSKHRDITSHIYRLDAVNPELIEKYNQETAELQQLARRLTQKMKQESFEQSRGGKRTGLYYGRLDTRHVSRDDGKRFYRRKTPINGLGLAVSVLVDESGSMSWDERITKARHASIVLYQFCKTFEIPVSIYGHSADNTYDLELYSYAEFDSIDRQDQYRLMDMQDRDNNRDGAAISYMAQRLLERPEQTKLLLIPNDGLPCAHGYTGSKAYQDVKNMVKKYEKLGIAIYALAMGDDCEKLREIYGPHLLDVRNLNQLPQLMLKLVKENIKER